MAILKPCVQCGDSIFLRVPRKGELFCSETCEEAWEVRMRMAPKMTRDEANRLRIYLSYKEIQWLVRRYLRTTHGQDLSVPPVGVQRIMMRLALVEWTRVEMVEVEGSTLEVLTLTERGNDLARMLGPIGADARP